ncbi:MAG: hypothetical protein P0116_05180 [Candidatus Nitrosocosmicus sp.]|nr:hypothetical protein [Candidatus Nitrosocosmicus sp.]
MDNEGIEIIQNPETFENLFYSLIISAKGRYCWNIFNNQMHLDVKKHAGTLDLIRERLETKSLNVRICP